jgi:hypothetical protein
MKVIWKTMLTIVDKQILNKLVEDFKLKNNQK